MKFYKYIIDCIISWSLIISLHNLYIKLMQRRKNRSLEVIFFLLHKQRERSTTIFFRYISFIYKLYKLIIRNHDIIQSIVYL